MRNSRRRMNRKSMRGIKVGAGVARKEAEEGARKEV